MAKDSGVFGSSGMCPCIRGMSPIQGVRIGGGGGVSDSGVWIKGVSASQGSGLEVCLQFRGLD